MSHSQYPDSNAAVRHTEPVANQDATPFTPESALRGLGAVTTRGPAFAAELERVTALADTDLCVLLLGESGTGKEHLARALHDASSRATGPFVVVNCSALPAALLESELFGHHKGAFTGSASDRAGIVASAEGGTLLLDEIGDAPMNVQNALLRVIETRRVRPVGSDAERSVNVRIMAATSRSLQGLMTNQSFRRDLYYRLAQVCVRVPALRERAIDVPLIARNILMSHGCSKPLTPKALTLLQRYPWPGNIRELSSALQRAIHLAKNARELDSSCFSDLEPVATPAKPQHEHSENELPPVSARSVQFPDFVRELATRAWEGNALPPLSDASQYFRRAVYRAILLSLGHTHGHTRFPPELDAAWRNLFRRRWQESEAGRGLKDLLKLLGASRNSRVQAWVLYVSRAFG